MSDKLEELKEKIYSRKGPKERKQKELYEVQRKKTDSDRTYGEDRVVDSAEDGAGRHEIGSFRPSSPEEMRRIAGGGEEPVLTTTNMPKTKKSFYKSKIFIFTSIVFFVSVVAAAGFVYYGVFQKGGAVTLEISGEAAVEAGDTQTWTVTIRNNLGVAVKNSELNFIYPKGAVPVDGENVSKNLRSKIRVEEMKPGEEREFDFTARIFGNTGEEKTAEVLFLYQPENISSRFQKQASFSMVISLVPIAVFYDIPEKVISGQDIKIVVEVTSSSKVDFNNLYMRVDWPTGLEFLSSNKKPDYENSIWKLGDLLRGESRRITINSRIIGFPEEVKLFITSIGEYNPQTRQFKTFVDKVGEIHLASPPLFVRQDVNRAENYAARFGEPLNFSVYYKNNLPVAVRDVFIRVRLSEGLMDLRDLKIEKGFFDGASRELVWNASSFPELKELDPGENGYVTFSAVVKKQPSITSFFDKDFVISSLAKIITKTAPEGFEGIKLEYENLLEIKLKTQLSVLSKAVFYNSPLGPNIGTLPPAVGRETGYTVVFQISNLSSDAKGVKLYASLPGNVRWLDQITGDKKEKLSFNPSSGELIWDAGDVFAGTGVVRPRMFLAFNVAITPGENAVNNRALLVKNIRIAGVDSFTKTALESIADDVTTELKEDLQTVNKDWSVVE
ncbi:MAG: hypothetical protein A3G49_04350 [Candidatus Sungbacteria bacterium RIFCSPLOWO2_12_FULL_41_11]|uniref:DUF11 domain-containing protein n=1 Tax=Candidatus Sungbacteria bacterium RIFCSPLOWO2_12_FULL_41_11 TaxID=1802286 RepID=A0A1G2LPV1_9BACT|nr:MAG: hypothetical protein UV01_C0001G0022 [Parcubacteria group bacterium GW2011_GWA2_42_14]OGZ97532.1 MAG: hypothetical protein A3D41_01460 [Candidatus Sungbacteria bacterium RIFCSPHIGHO2_02_FULL_41_12b]OHA12909.1 MAG: hypothetical protein A3G49_04350 [Candidatus Sungbacteria bacterium RIFCSPLOWO2_12_FULL_41_11]